jgi:hypothetical protein
MKMFSAGGQVPTHTDALASASALAIAKPNPASSKCRPRTRDVLEIDRKHARNSKAIRNHPGILACSPSLPDREIQC